MLPPCGLRVGGYRIEWSDEKGTDPEFGGLYGGVCLCSVGHA
jgi:hypothetical protein